MSIKEWGFVSFNSLVDEFLHLCQDIIAYESLAKKANYLQIIMEMALTDTVPWPFFIMGYLIMSGFHDKLLFYRLIYIGLIHGGIQIWV